MRTITIIYDGDVSTFKWIKTMLWAKDEFLKHGYKIQMSSIVDYLPLPSKFANRIVKNKLKNLLRRNYDIVFLAFHHSTSLIGCDINYRSSFLRNIRKRANLLCWLDTADSTGSCQFDVMPFIDLYFKKQLLKNKSFYQQRFFADRIFADYYYKKYKLEYEIIDKDTTLLSESDISKLRIAWNISYYDYLGSSICRYLRPFSFTMPRFVNPAFKEKDIDIHFSGSIPKVYGPVIGYQRAKMLELINNLTEYSHPDVYKQISRDEYLNELKRAKAIASPFGWGECCLRDMEAFIHGAVLLKPSMDHCDTFPNIYIPYKTYVPLKWDFSDFNVVLQELKSGKYISIAKEGQNLYKQILSKQGKVDFVAHLITQLTL